MCLPPAEQPLPIKSSSIVSSHNSTFLKNKNKIKKLSSIKKLLQISQHEENNHTQTTKPKMKFSTATTFLSLLMMERASAEYRGQHNKKDVSLSRRLEDTVSRLKLHPPHMLQVELIYLTSSSLFFFFLNSLPGNLGK